MQALDSVLFLLLCVHTHAPYAITLCHHPPHTSMQSFYISFSPPPPPFSKVHRLPVEECSNFTDCSACITSGGLLCGWCSVENKCSRRPQCANSNSSDGLRWVQTTDRCLTVDIASAVSISGEETAYPRETSSIVSWKRHWTVLQNVLYVTIPPIHLMNKTVCVSGCLKLSDP